MGGIRIGALVGPGIDLPEAVLSGWSSVLRVVALLPFDLETVDDGAVARTKALPQTPADGLEDLLANLLII
jgi:hypothetical protein